MKLVRCAVAALVTAGLGSYVSCGAQGVKPKDAIRHIVVIFQENVSFDHYFATYPNALNPKGEPKFTALPGTPAVEGLTGNLLTANPNFLNAANGAGRANPFRLRRDQAATADQDHSYQPEQMAFDGGKMDLFPKSVGTPDGPKVPGEKAGITSMWSLGLRRWAQSTLPLARPTGSSTIKTAKATWWPTAMADSPGSAIRFPPEIFVPALLT